MSLWEVFQFVFVGGMAWHLAKFLWELIDIFGAELID